MCRLGPSLEHRDTAIMSKGLLTVCMKSSQNACDGPKVRKARIKITNHTVSCAVSCEEVYTVALDAELGADESGEKSPAAIGEKRRR